MGIDLGTANVVVYQKGKGIVADEPSVIAYRKSPNTKDEIIAIGRRAKDMIGKTPQSIITLRPVSYTHLDVYKRQSAYNMEADSGSIRRLHS